MQHIGMAEASRVLPRLARHRTAAAPIAGQIVLFTLIVCANAAAQSPYGSASVGTATARADQVNTRVAVANGRKQTESGGTLRWTCVSAVPGVPVRSTKVVFQNLMWITSGVAKIWKSADGVTWELVTDNAGWPPRGNFPALAFDNRIWVLGGEGGIDNRNDVWYSNDGEIWIEATPAAPWLPRMSHKGLVFDNKMWILGGVDPDGYTFNDVWYSEDGANWVEATGDAPWVGRYYAGAVVFDGKMWIHGGISEYYGVLGDMWSSADGSNWTYEGGGAGHRFGHQLVVWGDRMWILGGWYGGTATNRVWSSTDGRTWTESLPKPPWDSWICDASLVFNDKLWVLGGYTDGGVEVSEVWYAELSPYHSVDQDEDNRISVSELLRAIQFFNSGGYHCADGTEDGYAPGPGEQTGCAVYSCDYKSGADWEISLSELLRVVQFYNGGGYYACAEGEDGFCTGAD